MNSLAARQGWAADGVRFLLAGAANTLITLAVYELLLFATPPWLAYSLSWLCGLLFVVLFYPSRVFAGGRRDFAARAALGASYVGIFLLGLGTLKALVTAGVPARISIFAVVAVTTGSNFILGRLILAAGNSATGATAGNDRASRRDGVLLNIIAFLAEKLERFAIPLYALVILTFLAVFGTAASLLTVEADEAWILLSTMNAFGIALPPSEALASPTLTSGGIHLLIHGALAWIGSNMIVHRLVSLLCALLLLVTVFMVLKRLNRPTPIALAATALFAAVPGFIFQASLATAEIIATLLLFWGCLHWVRRGQSSYLHALSSGFLIGLACSTRVNCVVALPAILIYAIFAGSDWRRRLVPTVLTMASALATLGVAMGLYYLAAHTGSGSEAQSFFLSSSGVEGVKSPTHLLWAFVISDRIMPIWLMAAIGGAYLMSVAAPDSHRHQESTRLSAIFLLIGLGGIAAWVAKAPIPHVRYLWPAVPCLWFAGIVQLTQLFVVRRAKYEALALHLLILAACGTRLAADALIVANGESLTLVYQANGMAPYALPTGSFHAAHDQRALAAFLAGQPPDARFYAAIPASAFPIILLSKRTIARVETMSSSGPRYVVMSPGDLTVWHPDAAFIQWIRTSTEPAFVSGDFAAFRVKDEGAPPPAPGMLRLGGNDLLRPAMR
jgi:hypothetical protein